MTTTTKNKKTITIAGIELKLINDGSWSGEIQYQTKFTSKDDLCDWYESARKECFATNFAMNPFEWAAYGQVRIDGVEYIIDPPKYCNGDSNWYSYPDTNCFVTVRTLIIN